MNFEKKFGSAILKITISTQEDGDMSITSGGHSIPNFLSQNNLSPHFSDMTQDHGVAISQAVQGKRVAGDGIWTQDSQVGLVIRTADCLSVVLFDESTKLLIALHCGLKGVRGGLIDEAIKLLNEKKANCASLFAFLGPCICPNCYIVDEDRFLGFKKNHETSVFKSNTEFHIDIRKAVLAKLIANGIIASNVQQLERCTKEDSDFFSYRRGNKNERFITVAQMTYV